MKRWTVFVLLLAALSLAAPQAAEAMSHRGGKGGMKGKGRVSSGSGSLLDNPLSRYAPAGILKKAGLIETGLRPIYPESAECLEIKSHFSSPTRFDGSFRKNDAFSGYHSGVDITSPIGTPLIAIADGEVIHKYTGGQLVGNQTILRHTPEDTGLPVYLYSKYKHMDKLPDLEIGERVKMGQFISPSGDTGTVGGHFPTGYPHLHLSIYTSASAKYLSKKNDGLPQGRETPGPGGSVQEPHPAGHR